jgi:hypothetical protein
VFAISDLPGSMMSLRPRERTSSRTYSNHENKCIQLGRIVRKVQ